MKSTTKFSNIIPISGILMTFFFSGCMNLQGNTTTKTDDPRLKTYDSSDFSLKTPKDWEIIEKKDFTADVPDVTVVVFRNNIKNETFTANVNIVKNYLQETMPTLEYAKNVLNRQKGGLFNFKENKREELKLKVGGQDTSTIFIQFEAKKGTDQPTVRYIQTYAVKEKWAFIITGALSTKENDVVLQSIENIIKSFQVK